MDEYFSNKQMSILANFEGILRAHAAMDTSALATFPCVYAFLMGVDAARVNQKAMQRLSQAVFPDYSEATPEDEEFSVQLSKLSDRFSEAI